MSFDVKEEANDFSCAYGVKREAVEALLNRARADAVEATVGECADDCRQQATALEKNGESITAVWAAQGCALRIECRRKREEPNDE